MLNKKKKGKKKSMWQSHGGDRVLKRDIKKRIVTNFNSLSG